MKLMTKEVRDALPPLYSQDGKGKEAKVVVKFFTPTSSFTWFVTEASAVTPEGEYLPLKEAEGKEVEDTILFGFVTSSLCPEGEFGYISLNELTTVKGPLGLGVERDLHFRPRTVRECVAERA